MSEVAPPPNATPLQATLAGLLLAVFACGCGRTPIDAQSADLSTPEEGGHADDGGSPGDAGQTSDALGRAPLPVCAAGLPTCVPPDAGLVWTGAAVVACQPADYAGPETLLLERGVGIDFQVVQARSLQSAEFGATFYDETAGLMPLTYRVCVQDNDGVRCGAPFTSLGAPHCGCEPTNCWLLQACNSTIDDGCGNTMSCGACMGGVTCNPANHTCCADGFMPDDWGGCVCAPPAGVKHCCWNTTTCSCEGCNG
jgi:hypothetical protein